MHYKIRCIHKTDMCIIHILLTSTWDICFKTCILIHTMNVRKNYTLENKKWQLNHMHRVMKIIRTWEYVTMFPPQMKTVVGWLLMSRSSDDAMLTCSKRSPLAPEWTITLPQHHNSFHSDAYFPSGPFRGKPQWHPVLITWREKLRVRWALYLRRQRRRVMEAQVDSRRITLDKEGADRTSSEGRAPLPESRINKDWVGGWGGWGREKRQAWCLVSITLMLPIYMEIAMLWFLPPVPSTLRFLQSDPSQTDLSRQDLHEDLHEETHWRARSEECIPCCQSNMSDHSISVSAVSEAVIDASP